VFYLRYVRDELVRRRARTFLAALALAVGVALVIDVAALGSALHTGQTRILDPLATVGSDLLVTRATQVPGASSSGVSSVAGANPNESTQADLAELDSEMQSVVTDLANLGKPGAHFVHDFFLPSGEPVLPSRTADQIRRMPGVDQVSTGLTLQVMHQQGTVPKIVADLKVAARTITVHQSIRPLTSAEQSQIQGCVQAAQQAGHLDDTTFMKCLPKRYRNTQFTVTIPSQTIQQVVKPPQTDIQSSSYSIGGIDPTQTAIGIVTPAQITSGSFLQAGKSEALLAEGYAQRRGLALNQDFVINASHFRIVGLVKPPLAGQAADVYIALPDLQKLSQRTGSVNVVLVRAASAGDVALVTAEIHRAYADAQVTASSDLAAQVSGSLVDARNLIDRTGRWLAGIVVVAACSLTCMLMLAAVGRRVRELGTLRAIGWSSALIVRQVLAESLVIGLLGGMVGVALGVVVLAGLVQLLPPLQAVGPISSAAPTLFGMGAVTHPITETVRLQASTDPAIAGLAVLLAVAGGLLAGGGGAARAARLRPADALRELG
jgi:ABC-type lipoprotein release transport system permease subunit